MNIQNSKESASTIRKDARYTVSKEWCGNFHTGHVTRFSGQAIAFCNNDNDAWQAAADYQNNRMKPYDVIEEETK